MDSRAELGVLFVHGIGDQQRGETLIHCAGPLFEFVKPWLDARKQSPQLHFEYATLKPEGRTPAHAMASLSTSGDSGPHDHRILLAEGYWGDAFVAPPASAFAGWAISVLPFAIGRHFGLRAARAWKRGGRGGKIAAIWHVLQLEIAWLLAPLPLLLLFLLRLAWLIPISSLRNALKSVQLKLMSTLGDSFAVLSSQINEASIRTRVLEALDWLAAKSERVVVIAHSQGAAVAASVLRHNTRANVKRLITYGAGIRKLSETSSAHDRPDDRVTAWAGLIGLPFGLLLIWVLLAQITGPTTGSVMSYLSVLTFLLFAIGGQIKGLTTSLENRDSTFAAGMAQDLAAQGVAWTDIFATHDPVSNGALFDGESHGVEQVEVANQCSILLDHSTYWQNRDQFVPAVAARIFERLPGALGEILSHKKSLRLASLGRLYLADSIAVIRFYIVAAAGLTWIFSNDSFSSLGIRLVSALRWIHDGLESVVGEDLVFSLPKKVDAFPYLTRLVAAGILTWLVYEACLARWRSVAKSNFEALVSGVQEDDPSRQLTAAVLVAAGCFLFAVIPNLERYGKAISNTVFAIGIVAPVAWLTIRGLRRRDTA